MRSLSKYNTVLCMVGGGRVAYIVSPLGRRFVFVYVCCVAVGSQVLIFLMIGRIHTEGGREGGGGKQDAIFLLLSFSCYIRLQERRAEAEVL